MTGRAILLCLGVFVVVGAYLYADSTEVRYRSEPRNRRVAGTTFEFEHGKTEAPKLDVAFLGASRTQRAVMAVQIQEELTEKLGRPVHVKELGSPFAGMGMRYLQIRDLIKERNVATVVLEYSNKFEQFEDTNPDFYRLASITDILNDPLTAQSSFQRKSQRLSMIARKYATMVGVSGRRIFRDFDPERSSSKDGLTPVWIQGVAILKLTNRAKRKKTYLQPSVINLQTRSGRRSDFYLKKIVELAEKEQVKLLVWNIPSSLYSDYDDESKQLFEERYGRQLLSFSNETREKIRINGYADVSHLNRVGAMALQGQVVQWLIEQGDLN